MPIAFAGTAPFGAAMLRALLDGPGDDRPGRDDLALVISQPDRPKGRGKQLSSNWASVEEQLAPTEGAGLHGLAGHAGLAGRRGRGSRHLPA